METWQNPPMRLFMIFCVMLLLAGCDTRTSVERAREEGVLIVGNNTEPQSFDPHIATSVSDFKIINSVMEGLLRGDSRDDAVFHPAVAESWTHNPEADKWRFFLRKDAVWSDGAPLTAHDFVYAYHRLLHPEFGGRYADMLYPLKNAEAYNRNRRSLVLCGPGSRFATENGLDAALLDRVDWRKLDALGIAEWEELWRNPSRMAWPEGMPEAAVRKMAGLMLEDARSGRPDLWDAAGVGVRAADDHTLELTMHSPMPQLPLLLLHCTWFPVPRHAVEARGGMMDRTGAWTRPGAAVGNGPFLMAEHRFNDYVEVRRNPHYRNAGAVRLNGVRFLPTVNGFTETRMFFNGKLHVTNNVPPEMTAYTQEQGKGQFCQDDYYVTIFYRLNTGRVPLNDARVRQALSLAVDREALVRDVVCGGGQPCFGFTPDGAGYKTPHGVEFNPEKARALLAQAGFPGGKGFPRLELMTTSREVQKTMAEAIQGMWKRHLGIHVDIRSCEWTAYKFAQNSMQYDFSSSSWSGDYLDPSSFLDLWSAASGNNNTGWSHPEYERLLAESRATGDQGKRMALLARAEALMLAESPVIPLYWARRSYLKRPEVQGWHPLLLDNHLFEDMSLGSPPEHGKEVAP